MITAEELSRFPDTFNGDDEHLVRCIEALLSLDATGTLVPHGIGGHARGLLSAAMHRLASQSRAAVVQGAGDANVKNVHRLTNGLNSIYDELQRIAPWSESNDMETVDEIMCGLGLLAQTLATPQPPNTIRVDVEQIGSCELDVRDGVAYMPDVTVQDIVSKSCLKPQPPKDADCPSNESPGDSLSLRGAAGRSVSRPHKDAGAVPIPDRPALPLRINRETLTAPGKWTTQEAEVIRAYGNAREAAGRADAVPATAGHEFLTWCASWFGPDSDEDHLARAVRDLFKHPPAEPAARAQVVAPEIDAVYKWCAARSLFGAEVDEVYDDDIVAALDDYEGALIEAAELAVNQLPKSVRLYSKKELEACESSASAVARAKAFDEVREMCAPLGYESFREAFDALGKLQASPAHTGAGAEALRLDVAEEPKA